MFNKREYKSDMIQLQKKFESFVEEENFAGIAEVAKNSLPDRAYNFLTKQLPLGGKSLEQYLIQHMKEIALVLESKNQTLSLEVEQLFSAGYSTAADIEITKDFIESDNCIQYKPLRALEKPSATRTVLGGLSMEFPQIIAKDIYNVLSSLGTFSLGGNNIPYDTFKKSHSIADQLAYEVYEQDKDNDLLHTYRQGDHTKHNGITGLAGCISQALRRHLLGKTLEIGLYMTAEPDFLIRKNHEYIQKALDGFITVKLKRKNAVLEYAVEK